jgi:hypothetical protein
MEGCARPAAQTRRCLLLRPGKGREAGTESAKSENFRSFFFWRPNVRKVARKGGESDGNVFFGEKKMEKGVDRGGPMGSTF